MTQVDRAARKHQALPGPDPSGASAAVPNMPPVLPEEGLEVFAARAFQLGEESVQFLHRQRH